MIRSIIESLPEMVEEEKNEEEDVYLSFIYCFQLGKIGRQRQKSLDMYGRQRSSEQCTNLQRAGRFSIMMDHDEFGKKREPGISTLSHRSLDGARRRKQLWNKKFDYT